MMPRALFVLLVWLIPVGVGRAQPQSLAEFLIQGMPAHHRQEARTLAICALAEAGGARLDHAGILHVLRRRSRQLSARSGRVVTAAGMARRYCRIFRDPPAHRAFLLAMRWGQPPHNKQYAYAWQQAQLSVVLFLLNVDVDPCDGRSMHWGSHADAKKPPRGSVRVACGPTRNIFWTGPLKGTHI